MKLTIKINDKYRVADIERDDKPSWIEKYQQVNPQKLPLLPNFMLPFVNWYIVGEPITKNIEIIPISGQQWQKLTNSERAELLELVEFTGKNAEDYVRELQSHFPRDPDFSKRK